MTPDYVALGCNWVAVEVGEPFAMFAENGVALSGRDELLDRN